MRSYEDIAHVELPREQEYSLIRQAQAGDLTARDELVEYNIPLVRSIAQKYAAHGITADELVADGSIGLMEAIAKFDTDRNTRLSSYAYRYIQGAICESPLITLQADAPSHWRFGTLPKYYKACAALRDEGIAPTVTAVAERMDASPETVEHAVLIANRSYISLYQNLDDDSDDEPFRVIDTIGEEDPEVARLEQRDQIEFFLSKLDPVERQIIEGWYGFPPDKMTLVELSEELGIERRKVATMRDLAITKMQVLAKMDAARESLTRDEQRILEGTATFESKRQVNEYAAKFGVE